MFVWFFFYLHGGHLDLHVLTHSFPTRRSSDLRRWRCWSTPVRPAPRRCWPAHCTTTAARESLAAARSARGRCRRCCRWTMATRSRSEEHTSELQSLMRISYAVFCLKKKNTTCTFYAAQTNKQLTTHKSD